MEIERTKEESRRDYEQELRRVTLKIEVKTHVKEYSMEKVAHYLTMVERLGTELVELEKERVRLENDIRETLFHVVK
jgi:phage gp16-like protein